MSLDELSYWITFNRVSGIGPVSFKSLLEYFDNDLQAAWQADTKELAQAGLTRNTIENVITLRKTSTPLRELEKLEKLRIRVIIWKDKTYPPLLREIDDSPPVLYTYGKLTEADQFALAVVGTRNSTTYGRQVTERIVTDLAKGQEVTIVSGLALGIDTIAHTAALTIVAFYSLYL
ncbi:MAG: DNA-processing protein DprA, partial [Ktedonobacteraceae bacterium]